MKDRKTAGIPVEILESYIVCGEMPKLVVRAVEGLDKPFVNAIISAVVKKIKGGDIIFESGRILPWEALSYRISRPAVLIKPFNEGDLPIVTFTSLLARSDELKHGNHS